MKIGQKQDEDLKELKTFPRQVIEAMLIEQERQLGYKDISAFIKLPSASKHGKGFSWCDTKNGRNFWSKVITDHDFELFFREYKQ